MPKSPTYIPIPVQQVPVFLSEKTCKCGVFILWGGARNKTFDQIINTRKLLGVGSIGMNIQSYLKPNPNHNTSPQ